jgi:hypothetical protein
MHERATNGFSRITATFLPDSDHLILLHRTLKWFTEFGHLNRGDMLTSEQHRCSNEKKKFQPEFKRESAQLVVDQITPSLTQPGRWMSVFQMRDG